MRDSQRSKFYSWEDSFIIKLIPDYNSPLCYDDCVALMQRVCNKHKIPMPLVKITRKDSGKSYYRCMDHSVNLSIYGHRYGVVLHEIAHAIACKTKPDDGGHGEYFVGIYCELMGRMFDISIEYLMAQAKKYGLKSTRLNCQEGTL